MGGGLLTVASASESSPTIEELYADHHGGLCGWLRRLTGDAFSAAGLIHDAFLQVLSKDVPPFIRESPAHVSS